MDRRVFLGTMAGGLLAAPLVAEAEQSANVPRIGYLSLAQSPTPHLIKAFHQGLRELGYFEGQNIIVEYRWAQGDLTRLPDLAADLARRNVRLIVATSNREITAAKDATTTIPIVMVVAIDPVGAGLIASTARPGGNLTGLAWAPAVGDRRQAHRVLERRGPTPFSCCRSRRSGLPRDRSLSRRR